MNTPSLRLKEFIFTATLGFLLVSCTTLKQESQPVSADEPPNVLFIMVDDLLPTYGPYGAEQIQSPNMDRLASEGTLFERAYVQVPVCGASRVSLLTGLRLNSTPWWSHSVDRPFRSLPGHFKDNGYHTVSLGKIFHNLHDREEDWSEAPWRSEEIYHGEEDWAHYNTYNQWQDSSSANYINTRTGRGPYYEAADVDDDAYQDGKLALEAIDRLHTLKDKDAPFFLAVGFWRPHLPFNAPLKYWEMYDSTQIQIADNRQLPANLPDHVVNSNEILQYSRLEGFPDDTDFHVKARHAYFASVSYVDALIGRLLDTVEDLGLSDNTIIVVGGDHGFHLGEYNFWGKHNLLHNATHIPLMIKAPGFEHRPVSEIVEFLDIYPTLSDLAGLELPDHLDGQSTRPLLENNEEAKDWKNESFSIWHSGRNIVTPEYSYTYWPNTGSRMLFDHRTDPDENFNVADEPEYQEVIEELHERLKQEFGF